MPSHLDDIQKGLPSPAKFFLDLIIALVIAALAGLLTSASVQIALGLVALLVGLVAWFWKIAHAYLLSIVSVALLVIGIWFQFISPPQPPHFTERIKEVYENSLTPEQRKNLGKFVGDTYIYNRTGSQYTLFDRGVAIYFRPDPETKNKNASGRSFFLSVKE